MPLRAMLWKEIRENAPWTALALVALGLAAGRTLAQMHSSDMRFDDPFDTWLIYGAPLFGIALGLLQILPEKRCDQWAFLVSRPASRDTLFWSKVLAGTLLYFVGTLPVWLGACAWIATPGHVAAPFDWHEALPGIADILVGHCFYAAALLVALRPALWYGSMLPFLIGVFAFLISVMALTFIGAVVILTLVSLTLLTAAWGSFQGTYRVQPRLARLATALTLFISVGILTGSGLLWLSLRPSVQYIGSKFVSYQMTASGQVVRETELGNRTVAAEDLQGHRIPIPPVPPYSEAGVWRVLISGPDENAHSYRDQNQFAWALSSTLPGTLRWYYLPMHHRFFAYSIETRRHTETMGSDAIRFADEPEPAPFTAAPILQYNNMLEYGERKFRIPCANGLFVADLDRRTVSQILTVTLPERVLNGVPLYNAGNRSYIATTQAIYGSDQSDRIVSRIAFPVPPTSSMTVQIQHVPGTMERMFWFQDSDADRCPVNILEKVADDGTVLTKTVLPHLDILTTGPATRPLPFFSASHLGAICMPLPISAYILSDMEQHERNPGIGSLNQRLFLIIHLYFATLGSILSALAACPIGRRCVFNKRDIGIWALLCLVFGFSAVLVMLSLRAFPTRKPCPQCKKQRSVERDLCEHCGNGWSSPPQDGTEVFDDRDGQVRIGEILGGDRRFLTT